MIAAWSIAYLGLSLAGAGFVDAKGASGRSGKLVQSGKVLQKKEEASSVPTIAALSGQIDDLATRYEIRPRRLARLRAGLEDPSIDSRRFLLLAIQNERATQKMRTQFDTYQPNAYEVGKTRPARPDKKRTAKDPKLAEFQGVFSSDHWQHLDAEQRASALGLTEDAGEIRREGAGQYAPSLEQVRRSKIYRRAPRYIDGLLHYIFGKERANKLAGKLNDILQPTPEKSYQLFADKITLLYPDSPITPPGKPRYSATFRALVEDAAFVFVQTYELTDPNVISLLDETSRKGTPVYALLGSATPGHPALPVWTRKGSRVRFATSYMEDQGTGRQYRIDHNKNVFVVKKDGTVVVLKGGMNLNQLSTQNVDLGHALEGGNVGLDVLGPMVRDFLRAGGTIKRGDLRKLGPAIEGMIGTVAGKNAISVETAQTSSGFVGQGKVLSRDALDEALSSQDELFVSGGSVLAALTQPSVAKVTARKMRFLTAAKNGKRIVISMEPTLSAEQRDRLRILTADFAAAGVEVVDAATISIDNSTEAVMHRLVRDASKKGEGIWQAAFAGTDGNFTRRIIEASDELKEAEGSNAGVRVILSDIEINERKLNSSSAARMLFQENFSGKVVGVRKVPGPIDEKGGRKMHMKALASYRPADKTTPASGFYMLKSNNDSKHGFTTNEESSLTVHSPELALEVIRFMERVERSYGQQLKPALKISRRPLQSRTSLTKQTIKAETLLKDVVFIVMDFETDGFSLHADSRLTEQAALALELDAKGKLVPISGHAFPSDFKRYVHMGKDQYGTPKRLAKDLVELTGISNEMLHYEAGVVEVLNDFNGWVRTLEKKTGKTVLFVGHNLAGFDRRMYNDFSSIAGVIGNPYMDGDVADTLRASEKLFTGTPKKLVPAAKALGIKLPEGRAHDAAYDIQVNGLLFEGQLEHLAQQLGERNLRQLAWGQIRPFFLSKTALKAEAKAASN